MCYLDFEVQFEPSNDKHVGQQTDAAVGPLPRVLPRPLRPLVALLFQEGRLRVLQKL